MGVPLLLVAALLGLVLLCVVLAMLVRGRREARRDLAAAHAETEQLRTRLEVLEERRPWSDSTSAAAGGDTRRPT